MRLQEEFVSHIVARCLERRRAELAELERDVKPLEAVRPPFPRISYTDAVAKLDTLGSDMEWGRDLGGEDDKLLARIRAEQLPEDAYRWYLDLRKYGTFVHAGFGLGIERTVAWICGIAHIREAIAFPRTLYKLWP